MEVRLLSIFGIFIVFLPIATVLFAVFSPDREMLLHLYDTVLFRYVNSSLLLLLFVSIFSLIFGVLSAVLVSLFEFFGSKFFNYALILPLAFPSYIMGYIYAGFLGDFGIDFLNIYGASYVFAITLYPYIFITLKSSIAVNLASILESAYTLKASNAKIFLRLILPLSRVAIVGGLALVLMESLSDYGLVSYYGVDTFTAGIFRVWFGMGDERSALNLSAILLLFVGAILLFEEITNNKKRLVVSAKEHRLFSKIELRGLSSLLASVFCGLLLCFGFLIPFGLLIFWSLSHLQLFDAQYFSYLANSVTLAGLAALLCVIFAFFVLFSAREDGRFRVLPKLATLGYSIPGAVVALGIMIPILTFENSIISVLKSYGVHSGFFINGTIVMLLLAYLIRFSSGAIFSIDSGLSKLPKELDESAHMLGSSRAKFAKRVLLPLLKPSIFGALILVFIDTLKELPATMILRPFNFDTLAIKTYELASQEMLKAASVPALIIVLAGLLPVWYLNRRMQA